MLIHNLVLKLTRKAEHTLYTAISLNKANSIQMTTLLIYGIYYSFLKTVAAVAVLLTYVDQTSVL